MKNIIVGISFILFGCNSFKDKQSNSENSIILTTKIDTTTPKKYAVDLDLVFSEVTMARQNSKDSIRSKDRKELARSYLKEFAFCRCMTEGFLQDTIFTKADQSSGYLHLNEVIHSDEAVDSIQFIIKEYVKWIQRNERIENVRNYSLFCLILYESRFLDSIVNKLDGQILDDR